jgi:ribosome biogenesis GTPase
MTESSRIPGIIVRARSGFYDVATEHGEISSQLRGKLKQEWQESDVAAIGDRVRLEILENGEGVIEEIESRERVLSRRAPGREVEQVIVANPDQAIFVFACADPDPNFRMLDRFLVVAEKEGIPAVICANKIDLVKPSSAKREFGEYKDLGYPVLYTSAVTGKGLRALKQTIKGKLSVLAGPSGAGKSSLLNAIQPGLGLETQEVGESSRRGQHTTVFRQLLPLEDGGYVADTPGLKALALWDIEPTELDAYFREIAPLVSECDYSDCTHTHEPGCAVVEAVVSGKISPERYDSYLRMRAGDPD